MRYPSKDAAGRICRIASATAGLVVVSLGVYLQMQADLGIAPWNALNQGLALQFPITYGDAYMIVSCLILAVDIYFRESIGFGMLLDAFVVGWATDLCMALDPFPAPASFPMRMLFLLAGMIVVCFGQLIYMRSALGCGPRDAMLVALSKRVPKLTVGTINLIVFVAVILLAVLMGAPVGIGTLVTVLFTGIFMDIIFMIFRFDPRRIEHENFLQTCRALKGVFHRSGTGA